MLAFRARGAGSINPGGCSVGDEGKLPDESFTLFSEGTQLSLDSSSFVAAAAAVALAAAAAASSSSAFFDFFGAPKALNHALRFGVADGVLLPDILVSVDGAAVVNTTEVSSSCSETALSSPSASIFFRSFSNKAFSISSCISVDVMISSSSISSESRSLDISSLIFTAPFSISSLKLCCWPNPNPAVFRTLPRLSLGPVSDSGCTREFLTSFGLAVALAVPAVVVPLVPLVEGNKSSAFPAPCPMRFPLVLPGCNRSIVR